MKSTGFLGEQSSLLRICFIIPSKNPLLRPFNLDFLCVIEILLTWLGINSGSVYIQHTWRVFFTLGIYIKSHESVCAIPKVHRHQSKQTCYNAVDNLPPICSHFLICYVAHLMPVYVHWQIK